LTSSAPTVEVGLSRVLVATDFSEASENALYRAVVMARHYGAKLYLAHVVPSLDFTLDGEGATAPEEAAWRDLRSLENKLVETGALAGILHEGVVRQGEDVWEQLQRIVDRQSVDLIVVGTHGRTGLRKIVLGSVAESIFRHASCPVLTVGPHVANTFPNATVRHVLYPTDLSVESAQAAPYALSAAREHGARLTVLHVVEQLLGEAVDDREGVMSTLEWRLREFLPRGPSVPYNLNFRVEMGPTESTILEIARQLSADLIVLGLRAPDTFVDHLVWLSAYRIVCEARCPVLTVRSRKRPQL